MPGGVIIQEQELIIRSRVPRPFELPSHLYYSQLHSELTLFAHWRLARIQIFSACEKRDKEFLNEISAQLAIDFCRVGSTQSYVYSEWFLCLETSKNMQTCHDVDVFSKKCSQY